MDSPFVARREKRIRNASLDHIHKTSNPMYFRLGAHERDLSDEFHDPEILAETGFTSDQLEPFNPLDGESDPEPETNPTLNPNENFEGEDEISRADEMIGKMPEREISAVNVGVDDSGRCGDASIPDCDTGECGSPQEETVTRTVRYDNTDPDITDFASGGRQVHTGDGASFSPYAHDFSRGPRSQDATDCQLGTTELTHRHRRSSPKNGKRAQNGKEWNETISSEEAVDCADEQPVESQWDIDASGIEFSFQRVEVNKISEKFQRLVEARNQSFRKLPKLPRGDRAENKRNRTLRDVDKRTENIRKNWFLALRDLHRKKSDFFSSKEATLEGDSPIEKGKPAYESLPVTQCNNADIQEIFLTEYDRKLRSGGSYNSFLQLVMVAGQYLRLHIVLGHTNAKTCWEPGALYTAVCDRESLELFLNHYDAKGKCTTVMTKAMHLRKIAEYAKIFFVHRDIHLHAEAERSRFKLQKNFSVQKGLGRTRASRCKQIEKRIEEGKIFFPEDFQESRSIVRQSLDGIMAFHAENMDAVGPKRSIEKLRDTEIVRKWSMNLLLLLIFSAAGQRPQVYAQLKAPDTSELIEMREQARRMNFFEMQTMVEKTRRSLDFPNVMVHGEVLKYIEFHQKLIRKIIVERTEVNKMNATAKPLIMHTEHGDFLTSPQVNRVLKGFLSYHFRDMTNVTIMSLRSSFGTSLMWAYQDREIFQNLSEEQFLTVVGKIMNTSVEQLKTTYIGVDRSDFAGAARKMGKVISFTDDRQGDQRTVREAQTRNGSRAGGSIGDLFA